MREREETAEECVFERERERERERGELWFSKKGNLV
jgi:hypothetical protein